jgi:hypothetical protein
MDSRKDISKLNWALGVYSDVVRFGMKSNRIDESRLCLQILEEFEEYEKCYDVFLILSNESEGIMDKISRRKKR